MNYWIALIVKLGDAALVGLENISVTCGRWTIALENTAATLIGYLLGISDMIITWSDYWTAVTTYEAQGYSPTAAKQKAAEVLAPKLALLNNGIQGDVVFIKLSEMGLEAYANTIQSMLDILNNAGATNIELETQSYSIKYLKNGNGTWNIEANIPHSVAYTVSQTLNSFMSSNGYTYENITIQTDCTISDDVEWIANQFKTLATKVLEIDSPIGNYIIGSSTADSLNGTNKNDTIYGGIGNDVIDGGSGNNKLYGDSGNDVIKSGSGNDVINGGSGNNDLQGGTGADTYILGDGDNDITDSDGGALVYSPASGGYSMISGKLTKISGNYYTDNKGNQFQWNGTSGSTLTITLSNGTTTTVNNFSNGLFNLYFPDKPKPPKPPQPIPGLGGILGPFNRAKVTPPTRFDPIVFDIDSDGVETTTIENGTYFDHAGDGFAEQSAWVGNDDGILVTDTNSNLVIDNGSELVLSLNPYDTNSDGIINSNDTNFSDLKILTGNGTLLTLEEANIASINLTTTTTNITDSNGNTQTWTGTYTKTDGTIATMADYLFSTNLVYSVSTEYVVIPEDVAELPNIDGYGTVYSLHQAMAKDASGELQALIENFAAETDLTLKREILTDILYKWTGADAIGSGSRGMCINAKQLHVLEQFLGEEYYSTVDSLHGANPNWEAANFLNSAYANLSNYVYSQLESQSTLKYLYDLITLEYNSETGSITRDLSAVIAYIQNAIATDETSGKILLSDFDNTFKTLGLKDNSNYSEFYFCFSAISDDYKFLLDTSDKTIIYGTSGDDSLDGSANGEVYITGEGNDTVFSRQGDDIIYGGIGSDYIDSCEGNDTIYGDDGSLIVGNDGNDTIYSRNGDDFIHGYGGNDSINSGNGNDIVYGGEGNDTIYGEEGADSMYGGTGDDVYIIDENDLVTETENEGVDTIKVAYNYTLGENLENLEYTGSVNWIGTGNELDNTITGNTGNDTLDGKTGNDFLSGGGESDSYVFNLGGGNDTIYDHYDPYRYTTTSGGANDTIIFGEGITKDNITFTGKNGDLIITFNNSTDSITVLNQLLYANHKIENYVFADGTSYTYNDVLGLLASYGTSENDTIIGSQTGESIYGGAGDDSIYSHYTTYSYNPWWSGDRAMEFSDNDTIYGGDGNDTIYDDSGINYIDAGNGNDSIYSKAGDGTIYGGDGNDTLWTQYSDGANYLDGGNGNDYIMGSIQEETVIGGLGNDYLNGLGGNDTYIFNLGDGNDTIQDYNGGYQAGADDKLIFGTGITKENIMFRGDGNDLIITFSNSTDSIRVVGQLLEYATNKPNIETFIFSNGTSYTNNDVLNLLVTYGTETDDTITSSIGNDKIYAYAGNDAINSGSGNDTLIGGTGNDYLYGSSGNDTYLFSSGDGVDTITESSGTDVISFDSTVSIDNLYYLKNGNNLVIRNKTNADEIIIDNWYSSINNQIESILLSDGTSVTINPTVDPINETINEDNTLTLNVLEDYNGQLSIGSIIQGANGTVTIDENNELVYTPNSNYNGTDSFTYTLVDNDGANITKTVNLTVNSINDAPTATLTSAKVNENNSIVLNVLANASDVDGDNLSISEYTQATNGIITLNELNQLVYTPNSNYSGTDSFTYTISDGNGGTVTQTVNLTVNNIPTAMLTSATLDEDHFVTLDVIANASDSDGDILSVSEYTQTTNGTISLNELNQLVYTPNTNYFGMDSFTYTISDGNGGTVTQTVNLTINSVNDVPTATLASATVEENSSIVIDVLASASDIENDTLTIDSYTQAGNGTITLNAENELVYTPNVNYSGTDSFTYTISDGNGGTITKTVDLTVNPLPFNFIGDVTDDILTGNYKDNIIDGGIGADTMIGGTGNDNYYVDNSGDVITENSDEGTDTVFSSINYTLGNNVENLILTGTDTSTGIGNDLDNYITGNYTANILYGESGNDTINSYNNHSDTIYGGDGNDYIDVAMHGSNLIYGDEGNDTIGSYAFNTDTIYAGSGNDSINSADNCSDIIYAEDGNDTIYSSSNNHNTIYGGIGDDSIVSSSSANIIYGDAGDDTIGSYNVSFDTIYGGEGNDLIDVGDNSSHLVYGDAGNDTITSYSGNTDTIYAGDGDDYIYSSEASNFIDTGIGNDTITITDLNSYSTISDSSGIDVLDLSNYSQSDISFQLSGNDLIINSSLVIKDWFASTDNQIETILTYDGILSSGFVNSCIILGDSDDNSLTGSDFNEYIYGDSGNDTILGIAGLNVLSGGDGDDSIIGGWSTDTIYGGNGNDYIETDWGYDLVFGGADSDTIIANENVYAYGGDGDDSLISNGIINSLYGEAGNDTIVGSESIYAEGGDGDDSITGGWSTDTIYGGAGSDYIFSDWGADTVYGGDDEDTIIVKDGAYAYGGEGDDYVEGTDWNNSLYGDAGNDTILCSNGTSAYGGDGNDSLHATGEYNSLYGETGNDTIVGENYIYAEGGDGDDSIVGGWSNDTIYGGAGNDNIFSDWGSDLVYGGSDNDTITVKDGAYAYGGDGDDSLVGTNQHNLLYGEAGNDTIVNGEYTYAEGGDGNDSIVGSWATDTIYGGIGDDTITGGKNIYAEGGDGNDYITGGWSNDTIYGGAGNDFINGSYYDDSLYGGEGNDTYSFSLWNEGDSILDTSGTDKIVFDSTISKNNIAIYLDSNDNLVIDYGQELGFDVITVASQSTNTIEQIQLNDGSYLTDSDINSLIQNMTAYANNNSIEFTGVSDVKNNQDLLTIVANSWHS